MKDLIKTIFSLLGYLGKALTIIRNIIVNSLFLLLIGLIIYSLISYKPGQQQVIDQGSILLVNLDGDIVEEPTSLSAMEDFLDSHLFGEQPRMETSLHEVLEAIETAAVDPQISAILLDLDNLGSAGLNELHDIGEALQMFKDADKKIYALEAYYTQSQYYLASFADTIAINPFGGVDIHGMGVFRLYFKDAIEKLKINYNIFKVGSFKSALEPLTRNDMSAEDRQQNRKWLTNLWGIYTEKVSKNREMDELSLLDYPANIDSNLRKTLGDTAQLAKNSGFVDTIMTTNDVREYLREITGETDYHQELVSYPRYLQTADNYTEQGIDEDAQGIIGLIVAEGSIVPGDSSPGFIGAQTLIEQIRAARKNKSIDGLVLRINSGGGSAFAAEQIRQELLLFKQSEKPLVVSMGTLAASGAYWLAANADELWASPATITGSIGVFGAIPTFENSLAELGVYSDGVGTTNLAAGLNLTQALSPDLREVIQQSVEFTYTRFLTIVAEGRDLETRKVAQLAEGRVYDGATALELGLIDSLGSLNDALVRATELAGFDEYTIEKLMPQATFQKRLLDYLNLRARSIFHAIALPNSGLNSIVTNSQQLLKLFTDPNDIYAYCDLKASL